MRHLARRPLALGLAVAAAATVSGCTALSTGYAPPVTVTITPTVTVTAKTAPSPAKPSPTPTPTVTRNPDLRSPVKGRAFDLGKATRVDERGGNQVLVFDRWTVRGRSDREMGRTGADLVPGEGLRLSNRNTISFRIPVDPAAQVVRQSCVAPGQPAKVEPARLEDLTGLPDDQAILKLTLDEEGWATKVESNPACAGASDEPSATESSEPSGEGTDEPSDEPSATGQPSATEESSSEG